MSERNNELEKLKREKEEIELKIKALEQDGIVVVENAKIDKEHFPTARPDEWFVAVKVELVKYPIVDKKDGKKIAWRSVVRDLDRNKAIEKIDSVIKSLQELKRKAKEDNNE